MLKADVTKEYTKLEMCGDISDFCTDFAHIIRAVIEKLDEKNPEVGHAFRVMFTKGFMDGIMFDDDREHMEHYLAEGDRNMEQNSKSKEEFVDFLNGFIDFLKDKRNELEKAKQNLDELLKENDDEAE